VQTDRGSMPISTLSVTKMGARQTSVHTERPPPRTDMPAHRLSGASGIFCVALKLANRPGTAHVRSAADAFSKRVACLRPHARFKVSHANLLCARGSIAFVQHPMTEACVLQSIFLRVLSQLHRIGKFADPRVVRNACLSRRSREDPSIAVCQFPSTPSGQPHPF
jgi:hypothetical protein